MKFCPFLSNVLIRRKCIGKRCKLHWNFKTVLNDKKEVIFGDCTFAQMPSLLIEIRQSMDELTKISKTGLGVDSLTKKDG